MKYELWFVNIFFIRGIKYVKGIHDLFMLIFFIIRVISLNKFAFKDEILLMFFEKNIILLLKDKYNFIIVKSHKYLFKK